MTAPIMFTVDAEALGQVLQALVGPSHYIRELQATLNGPFDNPIKTLIAQYNEQASHQAEKE